jgi:hypothetical protein
LGWFCHFFLSADWGQCEPRVVICRFYVPVGPVLPGGGGGDPPDSIIVVTFDLSLCHTSYEHRYTLVRRVGELSLWPALAQIFATKESKHRHSLCLNFTVF